MWTNALKKVNKDNNDEKKNCPVKNCPVKNFPVITFPGEEIGLVRLANFEINAFTLAKIFQLVFSTKIAQCLDLRSKEILRKALDILRDGEMENPQSAEVSLQTENREETSIGNSDLKNWLDSRDENDKSLEEEIKVLKTENEELKLELTKFKSLKTDERFNNSVSSQTDESVSSGVLVDKFSQTEKDSSQNDQSIRSGVLVDKFSQTELDSSQNHQSVRSGVLVDKFSQAEKDLSQNDLSASPGVLVDKLAQTEKDSSQTDQSCNESGVIDVTETNLNPNLLCSNSMDTTRGQKRPHENESGMSPQAKIQKTMDEFREELAKLKEENERLKIKVQNDGQLLIKDVRSLSTRSKIVPGKQMLDQSSSKLSKQGLQLEPESNASKISKSNQHFPAQSDNNRNGPVVIDIESDEDEPKTNNVGGFTPRTDTERSELNMSESNLSSSQTSGSQSCGSQLSESSHPLKKKCTLCNIKLFNSRQYRSHVNSEIHRENVRTFCIKKN